MNRARSADGRAQITVGVYDEPEVIVSGVGSMLTSEGNHADVLAIDPDVPQPAGLTLDVLVCDPVGRPVSIEEYVAAVTAITDAPVLVFTWNISAASLRRSMAAGARGFLSKASGAPALAAAVDALGRGERTVPEPVGARMPNGRSGLSTRETEVLELICVGLSNLEIADDLFISVNSVKTYVRQIYQKIGVSRRAQAVAWGLAHGY
jgi:DNA-binding NarL/FixJ family response regulator